MNWKEVTFLIFKIAAVVLIGQALALISFWAIVSIIFVFPMILDQPYLWGNYVPYHQLLVVGVCAVVFLLMFLFNMRIKCKWLFGVVNIIVIVALCNPIIHFLSLFLISTN